MAMTGGASVWAGGAPKGWEHELEQRLPLATPSDSVRGMFLNGMLQAVRALGDEEAVRRCQEAGGEERFVEFFSYPVSVNLRMLDAAVRALAPRHGGSEAVLKWLGRQAGADFLGSTAGRVLLLLGRGDPRRLLPSLPSAYKVGVSFGERWVEWRGPRHCCLFMQREFMPVPFQEGVLTALMEASGALRWQVQGRQTGLLDSEYEVSWV